MKRPTAKRRLPDAEELALRLEEAEETLRAIRSGEVDALLISDAQGDQVYTLKSADYPYRLLIDRMNEGVATLTPEGIVLFANRRLGELVERPEEELLGRSFFNLVTKEAHAQLASLLEQGLTGNIKGEIILENSRGEQLYAQLSIYPVEVDGFISISMIVADIGEQKWVERELHRQNEALALAHEVAEAERQRYRDIFDLAPDGYIVTNPQGVIEEANRTAANLLRASSHTMLGQPLTAFVVPESCSAVQDALVGFSSQNLEKLEDWHVHFQPTNCSPFHAALTVAAVRGPGGQLSGLRWLLRDITDSLQAEEALRESERKFRGLLETAPDAIIISDIDGRMILVNHQTERLFGYERGELLGQNVMILIPPHLRERHTRHVKDYAEHPTPRSMDIAREMLGRHKEGYTIPLEISLGPMDTKDGKLVIAVLRDTTERMRAAKALETQAAQLQELADLLELARDAIVVRDLEGKILFWNRGAEEMYGWGREDAVGRVMHNMLRGEFPRPREEIQTEVLRLGSWEGELVHRTRGGSRIVVASRWAVRRDKQGHPTAILEINRDTTARKQAEQALEATNDLLETMFSSIDLNIAYLDQDFNYVRVNRAFAESDGRDPEFYVGKNHFDLYPSHESLAIFQEVAKTGQPYVAFAKPFVFPLHSERGLTYWDFALQPIKSPQGRVTGLVLSLVDVTEKVRTQTALQEAAERLRRVLKAAPVVLWAVNQEGIITLLEGKGLEAMGLLPSQLIGQPVDQALRDYPEFIEYLARALEGEEFSADVQWNDITFEVRYSPVRNVQEQMLGVIGVATDITERLRAERRLRELTRQVVLVQEEERRRVSRELHDEAGQALTVVKLGLEMIESELPPEMTAVRQRVADAVALTRETMEQIRLLAQDLRPPALDTVGLNTTLEGYCRDFARRTNLDVAYSGTEVESLPDAITVSFYRLLQEALANAAKHAQAAHVRVSLGCDAAGLWLAVQDDGKGFDPQKLEGRVAGDSTVPLLSARRLGLGLLGMSERIGLLGGSLEVDSKLGGGTKLKAIVPLPEDKRVVARDA